MKKSKKRYITDKEEELSYDIRNLCSEINDEITIIGNVQLFMSEKQFNYLRDSYRIAEYGYDGQVSFIKLQHLFTIEDIKNKINEICKEVK